LPNQYEELSALSSAAPVTLLCRHHLRLNCSAVLENDENPAALDPTWASLGHGTDNRAKALTVVSTPADLLYLHSAAFRKQLQFPECLNTNRFCPRE